MKTLIQHTRPVEVYYDRFCTPTSLINYFKAANLQKHSLHLQPDHKLLVKNNFPELTDVSKETRVAISLLCIHLQKSFQSHVIPQLEITGYDPTSSSHEYMVLDGNCLTQLDIITEDRKPGSFLTHLDHTRTLFGKRMLYKWVCGPLLDPMKIQSR